MPYRFEFDPRKRIVCGRLAGSVDDAVLREFYRAAQRHLVALRPRAGIWDLSGVDSFQVSTEVVRELAHTEPAQPDPERRRIVVAPADHVFGLSRMFQTISDGKRPNLIVVHTIEEAYAALNITVSDLRPVGDLSAPSDSLASS